MTPLNEEMAEALGRAQRSYSAACRSFRLLLHRALPSLEHLGRENNFFTLPLMRLMHSRAKDAMPPAVHAEVARAFDRFGQAETILTDLVDASHAPPGDHLSGFGDRATGVATTFTEIEADRENLRRGW